MARRQGTAAGISRGNATLGAAQTTIVAVHAGAGKAPTRCVHGRCLGWRATRCRNAMTGAIAVLLNTAAGGTHDAAIAGTVRQAFAAHGTEVEPVACGDGDALAAAIAMLGQQSPAIVVAGGGDGTVATIAARLVDADIALGVLPLGTRNHFARDLGIPLSLEDAVRVVVDGVHARVDAGELLTGDATHVFVNNSSLGLYPRIVNTRDATQRRVHIGKWPALVRATWQALRDSHGFDLRLEIDGKILQRRTPFVFVGNNRYALQGFAAGSRPRLDAGVLSVYVLRPQTLTGYLRLGLRVLLGRVSPDEDFEAFTARELLVESSRTQVEVALDGEVAMLATPLRYRIRHHALQVLVPRAGSAGSG
jgi:diacylglycerol kinase family enzyme